ncbi:DUF882 domain-containing protein, partial [Enterobacter hormaechei]|nr:DUF882 domain-containing protein [Enterobacter hormaechei]
VIGETTRWDHMGILGYDRDTTPKLAQEKNLVAYRGYSCDTATKLSLRCMFVREGGASDNPQRTLKEQNVFAVLKQLGFSSDLFAMQSEMWFYTNTMADNIAYREQIGAEPRNRGKNVDDMLLLSEMEQSLKNHLARLNHFFRDFRANKIKAIDPGLFDQLFRLQGLLGTSRPVQLISGYRSIDTNNELRAHSRGVAKKSYHTKGQAMDFHIEGVSLANIRKAALSMRAGGVGYYPSSNFVHIDTGPVRHW